MTELCDFFVLPFVEIELRLGTFSKNRFDSSIDRKYFEKIKEFIESGEWKEIIDKNTIEYIQPDQNKSNDIVDQMKNMKIKTNNLKLINENNKTSVILKENVKNEDFQLSFSPFDVRFSVNQEFKLNSYLNSFSKKDCVLRNKTRKTFIHDNFQYDLTIVNENIDGVVKTKHEIEIELLVNKETLSWNTEYISDFIECKVYDLVNIVEPMERSQFKLKLK